MDSQCFVELPPNLKDVCYPTLGHGPRTHIPEAFVQPHHRTGEATRATAQGHVTLAGPSPHTHRPSPIPGLGKDEFEVALGELSVGARFSF